MIFIIAAEQKFKEYLSMAASAKCFLIKDATGMLDPRDRL